jgi:hypothetical protein
MDTSSSLALISQNPLVLRVLKELTGRIEYKNQIEGGSIFFSFSVLAILELLFFYFFFTDSFSCAPTLTSPRPLTEDQIGYVTTQCGLEIRSYFSNFALFAGVYILLMGYLLMLDSRLLSALQLSARLYAEDEEELLKFSAASGATAASQGFAANTASSILASVNNSFNQSVGAAGPVGVESEVRQRVQERGPEIHQKALLFILFRVFVALLYLFMLALMTGSLWRALAQKKITDNLAAVCGQDPNFPWQVDFPMMQGSPTHFNCAAHSGAQLSNLQKGLYIIRFFFLLQFVYATWILVVYWRLQGWTKEGALLFNDPERTVYTKRRDRTAVAEEEGQELGAATAAEGVPEPDPQPQPLAQPSPSGPSVTGSLVNLISQQAGGVQADDVLSSLQQGVSDGVVRAFSSPATENPQPIRSHRPSISGSLLRRTGSLLDLLAQGQPQQTLQRLLPPAAGASPIVTAAAARSAFKQGLNAFLESLQALADEPEAQALRSLASKRGYIEAICDAGDMAVDSLMANMTFQEDNNNNNSLIANTESLRMRTTSTPKQNE